MIFIPCYYLVSTSLAEIWKKTNVHKGSYIIYVFQICDKIAYPSIVSVLGNSMMALAFIFIGPLPSLALQPSYGLITGSVALIAFGYANVMVSTFSRAQGAAIRCGFERDIDTYLLISGLLQLHHCYWRKQYNIL